jgi:hypothetical protein
MQERPLAAAPTTSRTWLVGPWFDLLLVANLAWPLLLLLLLNDGFSGRAGLQFWQVYFVTTPHRWITLALVFLDRQRFHQHRFAFLGLAATATMVCVGVRMATGALTCLLAVDYLWNAWHFAAQHHGIYRIYSRLGGSAVSFPTLEKVAFRGFVLYVALRVASATWPEGEWENCLHLVDFAVLLVPVALLLRETIGSRAAATGRLAYLASVCVLYAALLWAVHQRKPGLVLALATASALFHAVEYLSVVSWSVQRRRATGLLAHLAPRWGVALAVFALVLGVGGWLMDQWLVELWLLLNVVAAFLHYAYDGLIWKGGR